MYFFLNGVVKIEDLAIGVDQRVNGQRMKQLLELPGEEDVKHLMLH